MWRFWLYSDTPQQTYIVFPAVFHWWKDKVGNHTDPGLGICRVPGKTKITQRICHMPNIKVSPLILSLNMYPLLGKRLLDLWSIVPPVNTWLFQTSGMWDIVVRQLWAEASKEVLIQLERLLISHLDTGLVPSVWVPGWKDTWSRSVAADPQLLMCSLHKKMFLRSRWDLRGERSFITQLLHVDTSHPYFTYCLPTKLKDGGTFWQHANKHFGHLCNMIGGITKNHPA